MIFKKTIVLFFLFLLFSSYSAHAQIGINDSPNFSVEFDVYVTPETLATPKVKMTLRGADEIQKISFVLQKDHYRYFNGDGTITQLGSDIIWTPDRLVSELQYEVVLPHERRPGIYDSYGGKRWFITRTSELFPHLIISFMKTAKSLTLVKFHLPKDWDVVSAMPNYDKGTFRARTADGYRYDWPTGWLIFGKIQTAVAQAKDVTITFAYPKYFTQEKKKDAAQISAAANLVGPVRPSAAERFKTKLTQAIDIYEKVIPLMTKFMPKYSKKFLVIFGTKPMWKGGLSGEDSLFINKRIRNISHDFSSTLVHEYFHVCQGFVKSKKDGDWIVEGLAEYYSMRLLYEAGMITKEEFARGVELYKTEGHWGLNLTHTQSQHALYNSGPLVLYTLDEMIQQKTNHQKSMKDVVRALADSTQPVGTKNFEDVCEKVYGDSLKAFFTNFVYNGYVPNYREYLSKL